MLNKFLASFGIGAAKVDARLADSKVHPGGELRGEVHVKGGNVEQAISQIYMYLYTEYYKETNDTKTKHKEVLASYRVADSLLIRPGEEKILPFQLRVPYHAPISFGRQNVYLSTGLDIEMAVDPKDTDVVTVLPDPLAAQLLAEMEGMGFRHSYDSGICEYKKHIHRMVPFVQEFELKPTSMFRNELDEIELIFDVYPEGIDVLMQVDRRPSSLRGIFEEMLDLDEQYVRFTIDRQRGVIPGELERRIRQALVRR
ncbi:sporulation-control protein [Aneurinibacillus thermoaerophilus]|uniref:Sporulation-control protein n=1 Tax=Aneurinibacillus thermoaerophilus TaxID=143495 RepID=A0A1G8CC14_ANETH|nr:sporulation protein [Aneurinibacillus thermoaerophilus]SDH42935.1 sporulation-control protein [Aneurinibacillus thermoaerophilus]